MAWQAKSTPVASKDVVYVHSWMASLSELGHKEVKASWEETLAAYDKNRDGKIAKDEYPDESLVKIWFLYDRRQGRIPECGRLEISPGT